MRSVLVVVGDELDDDAVELTLVPDDGSVEQLSAKCSDPAFGERVGYRGAHWCLEYLHVLGAEDLVEAGGELATAVADKRPGLLEPVGVGEEQIAGGLGGPRSVGLVVMPA